MRCGSPESSSSPSAWASLRAGSIVTTATFSPARASPSASAAEVVVFPTPPAPRVTITRLPASRAGRSGTWWLFPEGMPGS